MKSIQLLVLYLLLAPWAHSFSSEGNTPVTRSDSEEIAQAALCAVLKAYNPPDATKRVCYVEIEGADTSSVIKQLKCKHSVSLKVGKLGESYDFRDQRFWDRQTGNVCELFAVKIESASADNGVVSVQWSASSLAVEIFSIQLVKRKQKWEVVRMTGSALS